MYSAVEDFQSVLVLAVLVAVVEVVVQESMAWNIAGRQVLKIGALSKAQTSPESWPDHDLGLDQHRPLVLDQLQLGPRNGKGFLDCC